MSTLSTPYRTLLGALLPIAFLISCGGGGGGSVPVVVGEGSGGTGGDGELGDDGLNEPNGGMPDFTVSDLTASPDTSDELGAVVTIANEGTAPGSPGGWALISTDPDFVYDFHYIPVSLSRLSAGSETALQPGDSASYELNSSGRGGIDVNLLRGGVHYMRFWVNPDLSVRAQNPGTALVEAYVSQEINYENNRSDLVAFENLFPRPDCIPDSFEPNDHPDEAAPLPLNTRINATGCDENYDVFAVELVAGESYELLEYDVPESTRKWSYTLVSPDGTFVFRNNRDSTLATAEETGTHFLIAAFNGDSRRIAGDYAIEIIPR